MWRQRHTWIYLSIHIYIYICNYTHTHVHTNMHIYIFLMHTCIHTKIHRHIRYTHIYICTCNHVQIYGSGLGYRSIGTLKGNWLVWTAHIICGWLHNSWLRLWPVDWHAGSWSMPRLGPCWQGRVITWLTRLLCSTEVVELRWRNQRTPNPQTLDPELSCAGS